jgi:hypothetical protein
MRTERMPQDVHGDRARCPGTTLRNARQLRTPSRPPERRNKDDYADWLLRKLLICFSVWAWLTTLVDFRCYPVSAAKRPGKTAFSINGEQRLSRSLSIGAGMQSGWGAFGDADLRTVQ